MLDQFIWYNVSRISPEAPVPVVEVEHETTMLDGAANVFNNIVSLGGNVLLSRVLGFANPSGTVNTNVFGSGLVPLQSAFDDFKYTKDVIYFETNLIGQM